MTQYVRRLEDIPGFSDIPLPGHQGIRATDKILIDPVTGSKNFMLMWVQLYPESGTEQHTHPVEQAYFVLSGVLNVKIAGEEYVVEKNSAVLIPANVKHEVSAKGKEPALFLVIFSPPIKELEARPH